MRPTITASGCRNTSGMSASTGTVGAPSPIHTHTSPARSSTGYVRARTLPQIGESGPSVSAALRMPVSRSNTQPW